MERLSAYLIAAVLVVGSVFAVAECGDSAVCGNGVKEGSEQCDNGKMNGTAGNGCNAMCQLISVPRASVQVFYYRLKDESPGFSAASASDLGIDHAHVVLTGPTAKDETWPANMNSNLWSNVTPGTYSATVTLFDAMNNALTKPVSTGQGMVDIPNTLSLMVNFHQADFLKQDYTGTLYFTPQWGSATGTCTGATPPVDMETVTVTTMAGAPVTGMSVEGSTGAALHKLDGTPGPCFSASGNMLFEKVADMTWGHYSITITGKLAGGALGYCKKFDDVFVGPGVATPTYNLLVPAIDADGGVTCP